jgi:DinB superfamily
VDRQLIEVYVDGGRQLESAYSGLSRSDLLAIPVPGTWSLQQIAIHMMDSDLIATDRMKRIASMDKPLLCSYDETAFSQLPGTNDLNAMLACEIFAKNREMTAVILRSLSDACFDRVGIHTEIGKVTLGEMVSKYIDHLAGHMEHIVRKRALLGKAIRF